MLENKRAETLRLLRESGKNVSGQELCEHFGISRTAVWKMMNQLKEEGYEIEAVQNKGYRLLNEPDLVTKDELESRTHTKYVGQTVYYSREVDSTNTWGTETCSIRIRCASGACWHTKVRSGGCISSASCRDIPLCRFRSISNMAA